MKVAHSRSIGQQLALSFGALMVVLGMLLGAVVLLHGKSRDAELRFLEQADPARERAEHLHRSIMDVGLSLRSYLLQGDAQHRQRFRAAAARAQSAADALEGHEAYELRERIASYLSDAAEVVGRRSSAPVPIDDEVRLARERQALVEDVRGLTDQARAESHVALATMAELRNQVRTGVLAACLLALLTCAVLWQVLIRSIRASTREILDIAGSLAAGDWKPALAWAEPTARSAPRSEWQQIARALGTVAWHLERRQQRLLAEGEVARIAGASLDRSKLTQRTLRTVVDHVGAEVGVVYVSSEDGQRLMPTATHSLHGSVTPLFLGEGLPGQAAKDRRTLVVRDIPQESPFRVKLGYDEAPPHSVAATPIVARDELLGVLLVGSLREVDDDARSFLESAASQLALGISNALAYETTQNLLADVRERSEVIQAQNEELQAQNEEIQAQNEEIQSQSEQLQVQHEEIHAQNEELKQHSEELELYGKRLREADERKTEFLGVLAHELRNPLSPIVSGLFLLKQIGLQGEQAERTMAVIGRQTEHLTKLIDDLMDVTRIAQGKVRLERELVDLADLVRSCMEDHRAAVEHQGVHVELELPHQAALVEGDRTRLYQIVGNLLSNAIKFTDAGGQITLQLTLEYDEVVLRVADNGVGIEPSLLEVLFTPFSQGANGLARSKGGLGLGLALVKSLVALHGGSVAAHSSGVGKGSEFSVRLPRQAGALKPRQVGSGAPASAPIRVLIIEDSADVAETLRLVLEVEGHQVAVARTGAEGLDIAREFTPEIVLCDLGLPVVDGYEVARRLRADPRFDGVLVVAVSGYASPVDKTRAMQAGFDRHVAKPVKIERLRELVAEAKQKGERDLDDRLKTS